MTETTLTDLEQAADDAGHAIVTPGYTGTDEDGKVVDDGESPKFSTKKFSLLAMLEKAGTVVPNRDVLPVLKNFLLEVTAGQIRAAATDLELSIVVSTEMVSTQRPGTAVFPAKRTIEILREAAEGDVLIDVVDQVATVSIGRATWTVQLQDGSEFPALPEDEDTEYVSLDRSALASALGAVRHAAAKDTARPSLMMIDVKDGKVRASDGVRFQQVELPGAPDMQIPINAVDDLLKILRSTEAPKVEVADDDTSLMFRIGADEFVAQKPTAIFPDVDEALLAPTMANDQVLSADRDELVAAIRRVRITADTETSAIILDISTDKITVKSKGKDGSHAEEQVDASWQHPTRSLSFNHVHLTDLLSSLESANATIKVGKDISPTRPQAILVTDEEQGMTAVLSQLRADWI